MKRLVKPCAIVAALAVVSTVGLSAEVKTRDKTQFKLEGMLGRVVGMFGGKAAREGAESTNAVRAHRKIEMSEATGRIIDLKEEKVYELDLKKKTYEVTTFDEIRRRLREAQENARREADKEEGRPEPQRQEKPEKEFEVDFDVKETGQKRAIAGHDARQVISTVVVREKGRTLEDGGGAVLTVDSWLGPDLPSVKELAEFDLKYAKAISPDPAGVSAEQMAAVVALYPMLKNATERLRKEEDKFRGTPLATTTTFEAVKSKEQVEQQPKQGGGLGGMLARRIAKRDDKPRVTVFTLAHETLEVSTTVPESDVAIPPGFKPK